MSKATPYPILANSSDFENPAQVEKINTIVKGEYNSFLEITKQKKKPKTELNNLVRSYSNRVANIIDLNFGEFCFVTFDMSTAGLTYDTFYPILKIKAGRIPIKGGAKPDISFIGVDGSEDWREVLNKYGEFQFTFNRLAQEQQIAFRTFTKDQLTEKDGTVLPIPQTGYHVTMTFFYQLFEEKK